MGLNNEKKKRNSHEKHIIHHTFARSRLSFFAVIATESRSLESLIFTKGNPKRDAPKIEEEIKVKKEHRMNVQHYYFFVYFFIFQIQTQKIKTE